MAWQRGQRGQRCGVQLELIDVVNAGLAAHALELIRQVESRLQTLAGNTHPKANAQNDQGPAPDSLSLEHMMLQLQRPPEQEQAVRQFIQQLHDPKSSNYHHWLT